MADISAVVCNFMGLFLNLSIKIFTAFESN